MHPDCLEKIIHPFNHPYPVVKGDHIVIQFDNVYVILTKDQVGGLVIIDENVGIDEITVIHHSGGRPGNKGFAQGIAELPIGLVTHGNSDVIGIHRVVEIILSISVFAIGSPGLVRGPGKIIDRKGYSVVGPVLHIDRREYMPVDHIEPGGCIRVMRGVDVKGVIEYPGRGVGGVHVGNNRVLGL